VGPPRPCARGVGPRPRRQPLDGVPPRHPAAPAARARGSGRHRLPVLLHLLRRRAGASAVRDGRRSRSRCTARPRSCSTCGPLLP
jgi:hypothetical protein